MISGPWSPCALDPSDGAFALLVRIGPSSPFAIATTEILVCLFLLCRYLLIDQFSILIGDKLPGQSTVRRGIDSGPLEISVVVFVSVPSCGFDRSGAVATGRSCHCRIRLSRISSQRLGTVVMRLHPSDTLQALKQCFTAANQLIIHRMAIRGRSR